MTLNEYHTKANNILRLLTENKFSKLTLDVILHYIKISVWNDESAFCHNTDTSA
jgi:hypothetical protein